MKNFRFIVLAQVLACVFFCACQKTDQSTDPQKPDPEKKYRTVTRFSEPVKVFGFQPQHRYAYCPSVIDNGDSTAHVWFCGNPQADKMVDNVYHIVEKADGTHSTPVSVLQPTPDTWDWCHTCDPSVIEGEFKMGGNSYRYAMFYLGIDTWDCKGNEVGVAFSNSLDSAVWVKYPDPIVPFTGDHSVYWGEGQASAVSLDKKGKVLLTYTEGYFITTIKYEILDMSDMDNIQRGEVKSIPLQGLVMTNGISDWANNADFALNQEQDVITMVRDVHPMSTTYPNFIANRVEVVKMKFSDFLEGRGRWTQVCYVGKTVSGFPRNHNSALSRDSFGHVADPDHPTIYYTVSGADPNVIHPAEWSYCIYKISWAEFQEEITEEDAPSI